MSLEDVKVYFKQWGRHEDVLELPLSSATVELAAKALDVEPERIAKTLAFRGTGEEEAMLVVAAGDAKIDNKKFRHTFGTKARMLSPEETFEHTGHAVGGVCPFGLKKDLPVYMDVSLKRFTTVFPACGSGNSAIELTCDELYTYGKAVKWVDVCKGWEDEAYSRVNGSGPVVESQ
ncbi:proline--tRNA ligase [Weizmannia acidilactici]|uniref:Proline--tRNA ligase n=2 Tax=Heyndrickxia TaxID=2837504 RepID=A0A5J4J579_9BACI|nr:MULTISPECIES: YbaK/EbsC family protein [Heyndrickxia]MDL5039668.1 YbaK/EbsC family protein [Heyndrickxia coagulans]GER66890.1 proline--tRNA ligase [Weizmannia acidilactici]GER70142.1 proline--tRNA ligase [Weizmannia acidilactici]GER74802.1 proline--tRNA ligase [Weizmannia acidilactici]